MKLLQTVIREGITHIEDLPLHDFINAVETLKEKTVTEKLDGSNLWFGVDSEGFFTSREGKSKKAARFYQVTDYPNVAAYNGFRGAHEALARHADIIKRHLQDGDMVETEVLFGRQPNTVTYGNDDKNFIVILRGIETDHKKVDSLAKALNGKHSKVKSTVITSDDGENLKKDLVEQTWEFTQVKPLDTTQVNLQPAMERLAELKKYLAQPNTKVNGKTNLEVAELSLNKVPKEQRDQAKAEREAQLDYIQKNFKNPIKKFLLDVLVRKVKPFLQSKDVDPNEDIGVEGVVATDKRGNMVKIVDKDMFTSINKFNNVIRSNIAGLVRTDDQDAPIEMRGGAFGQAKIRIANLLGMKELAISSSSKKILSKFKGADAAETAKNLADSITLSSFESARKKVSAILDNAVQDIDEMLQQFKDNADSYKLKLETGKEIGMSPEVMKRTLTAFAEAKRDINQVNTAVSKSRDLPEMIMALYGRTIQGLFSGDQEVKETKMSKRRVLTLDDFSADDLADLERGLRAQQSTKTPFSLLKTIAEDDAAPGAEAAADGTTSAGDIAPVEKRLINGRMITRRPRKFMKKKKFAQIKEGSLLKMFEFDSTGIASGIKNQFAKDVDDSVSAQNDVEFKSLRNQMKASGDEATTQDVTNYLDKAHELNDEVDTVTFGLEMDDGAVVKVYVNASEADAFEKALSDKLGEEDDVETVIDELANNFDIVDVEWPNGANSQSDDALVAVDQDNEITNDEDNQIDSAPDANGEEQINPVINLSPDEENEEENNSLLKQADKDADQAENDSEPDLSLTGDDEATEDSGDEEQSSDDSENQTGEEENTDEPVTTQDGDTGQDESPEGDEDTTQDDEQSSDLGDIESPEDEDESSEDEDTPPDDDGNGGGKKKKKPKSDVTSDDSTTIETTKESNMSFGQRFKDKLLAEKATQKKTDGKEIAPEEQHEFPEQLKKLMVEFPNPGAKMMIGLMFMLGVPLDAMIMKKSELKKSVDGAGDQYMKDSQLRMWVKKVIGSLKDAQSSGMAKEDLAQELTSQYQKIVMSILGKIGLTDGIEKIARSALRSGVKKTAAIVQNDNKVRTNLKVLADMLGVDTATGAVNEAASPASTVKRLVNKYILDVANDGDKNGPQAKKTEAKIRQLKNGDAILRIAKQAANKFGDFTFMVDTISKEDKVKLDAIVDKAVKLAESEVIEEGKNHLGNKEYQTWASWKAAVKAAAAKHELGAVWYDGDKDISQALVGANPYAKGKTFAIGEWDGDKGDVNQDSDLADTKARLAKVSEDVEAAPETGINGFIDDVKALAIALGIPESNVKYREPQVNLAVRKARSSIKNISSVQLQMKRLMKLLGMNE